MTNYSSREPAPWYSRCSEIEKVVIEDGVTNIGNYAFHDCFNLTSVEIPNSVTSIGDFAFSYCKSLTSIEIPNSVTSIGIFAFDHCSSFTSVKIPNSVKILGGYAFYYCTSLTSIEISNSVASIGDATFSNCTSLTSIEIPNSVTSIGDYAFSLCKSLTSVEIPNSVTSIGNQAFTNCKALTSIEIPNSVTSIGDQAFLTCISLSSVTIPNSVTSIGNEAFWNCKTLTSIIFKGNTPPTFGKDVFKKVDNSIPVYVPAHRGETYKKALAGYGFSNIKEFTSISLNDNSNAYTRNSQIDDADVSYTRDFSKYWEPLYIPFSLSYEDWKDDFEIAYINAVHQYDTNDDGDIDKTVLEFVKIKSGSTYPNTPYIIRAKEKGKKTLSAKYVTLYESDVNQIKCSTTTQEFIFTGNYKKVSTMDLMAYYTNKYTMHLGDINYINLITGVGAYRWYMEIKDRDSAYGINNNNTAKEISIKVVGEEATGIANIQHKSPDTQIYDLNGRRVNENNLKPGMYVKNGRKFVIK